MDKVLFDKIKMLLEKREEVLFAYLFGSHAKKKAGKLSDVDIGLYLAEARPEYKFGYKAHLITELSLTLKLDVDIVVLNDAPVFLQHQVVKYGVLLFSKDEEARILFQTNLLDRYNDYKYLYKEHEKVLLKRIEEGEYGR